MQFCFLYWGLFFIINKFLDQLSRLPRTFAFKGIATKPILMITGKGIVVRDVNCIHCLLNGLCSCTDYCNANCKSPNTKLCDCKHKKLLSFCDKHTFDREKWTNVKSKGICKIFALYQFMFDGI